MKSYKDITQTEQKALFFFLLLIVLGTMLSLFGYTPPKKNEKEQVLTNKDKLSALLAQNHSVRYDLNKVTHEELMYFRGIGPSMAVAIIDYQKNIGFNKVDDLINIRGIGARRLEEFREFFFVSVDTMQIVISNQTTDSPRINEITRNQDNKVNENLININTATVEQLTTLRGIGTSRANSIIDYRTQQGRFKTIEDIKNIHGIGDRTFDGIKDFITVGN